MAMRLGIAAVAGWVLAATLVLTTGLALAAGGSSHSASLLVGVSARHHPGFDRVVFTFSGAIPSRRDVRHVSRLTADPSGTPVAIAGRATLEGSFYPAAAHRVITLIAPTGDTIAAAQSAAAATAPPAAVKIATNAARARFHTTHIREVFSVRTRRDPRWVLVDGLATSRNRLWAAWLHDDHAGKWGLRYFDTTAPFQPQSTRHGRVPCDLYPAFSEARCPPPSIPSAAQIRARVFKQLAPTGNAATIGKLLRNGSYTFSFKPPANGTLVVAWYLSSKPTLIARGHADFFSARPGRITIGLTPAGKRILKDARTLKLAAKGTFTRILYAAVATSRTFTITR